MIRHGRSDWMMRHIASEITPELEHLRSDLAWGRLSVSRKYSALYG
jgi:hypothetical protein